MVYKLSNGMIEQIRGTDLKRPLILFYEVNFTNDKKNTVEYWTSFSFPVGTKSGSIDTRVQARQF